MVHRLQLVTLLVVTAWTLGGLVVDRHVGHAGQLALGVFTISGSADNDLVKALPVELVHRFDTPTAAIEQAEEQAKKMAKK